MRILVNNLQLQQNWTQKTLFSIIIVDVVTKIWETSKNPFKILLKRLSMTPLIQWLTLILELFIERWKSFNRLQNILRNKLPYLRLMSHPKVMLLELIAIFDWVCTMRLQMIIQWRSRRILKICNIFIIEEFVTKEFINTTKRSRTLLQKSTYLNVHHHISFVATAMTLWVSYSWL